MIQPLFLKPDDHLLSLKLGDELFIHPLDHKVYEDRRFRFDISFNYPGVIQCEPAIKTPKTWRIWLMRSSLILLPFFPEMFILN